MSNELIQRLHNPSLFDHPVERFELLETHISWVLLTGPYAYKIKKPVNFGFLDFSSLSRRHFFCEEEVRLNRRLAPEWYLGVVAITGSTEHPELAGSGPAIEYAVKMRQFPNDARLDRVLAQGGLTPERLDALVARVADFHGGASVAGPETPYGTPQRIAARVRENLTTIQDRAIDPADLPRIAQLAAHSDTSHAALSEIFVGRKQDGFVRECHGDLHLGNVAWVEDAPLIFDCIEFNDDLRWVDVISEVAFLVMDLEDRGEPALARRALSGYLEATGDYVGLRVFSYYHAYRSLVRAKVACLSWSREGIDAAGRERVREEYQGYLDLAARAAQAPRPFLAITCGVAGSGKSTVAQVLVEELGAVRIRSDVERKRLFGLSAHERSGSGLDAGLYAPDVSARTYARLADLAGAAVAAGFPVVVDATFLARAQRDAIRSVAEQRSVPLVILDIEAPVSVLRSRVAERAKHGRDASEADLAVLDRQVASREPLADDERDRSVAVDTSRSLDAGGLAGAVRTVVEGR